MGGMTTVTDLMMRGGLPRKLTAEECRNWVRELVAEGGRVTFRPHAFQRMEERDISNAQVMQVLQRGEVTEGPEYSTTYQNWKFRMEANTAGEHVSVVAAIEIQTLMGQSIAVITVI